MAAHMQLADIQALRQQLGDLVIRTPIHHWRTPSVIEDLGPETAVILKLELLQITGTFKPRGALGVMLNLPTEALKRGVTAVSAGNHAIATAYAAKVLGTTAKVVMMSSANAFRIEQCRSFGAELEMADDAHSAFARVHEIEREEGRTFVHPFDGPRTTLGTATVGLEFCEQDPNLDAVIVPIGGGGLCAGVSAAVKLMNPHCKVYGVEPEGADSMHRSFAAGKPQPIEAVRTIADSLGAPYAEQHSFELCRQNVDQLVRVSDDQMRQGMRRLFTDMKLAVEPAGAATTAALWGPLKQELRGKRVGLIVCGTNIDIKTFAQLTQ